MSVSSVYFNIGDGGHVIIVLLYSAQKHYSRDIEQTPTAWRPAYTYVRRAKKTTPPFDNRNFFSGRLLRSVLLVVVSDDVFDEIREKKIIFRFYITLVIIICISTCLTIFDDSDRFFYEIFISLSTTSDTTAMSANTSIYIYIYTYKWQIVL